jgi:CrcB protein
MDVSLKRRPPLKGLTTEIARAPTTEEVEMSNALWVGIGGFLGSILRFGLSGLVESWWKPAHFPTGTLIVNLLGCLAIGFLGRLLAPHGDMPADARAFLIVGLLGGFTTFSAFGAETLNLFTDGRKLLAVANIGGHVLFGLSAVWLGQALARSWAR